MVGSVVISATSMSSSHAILDDWLPDRCHPKDRDRAPRLVGVGIALDSSAHVLRTFTLFRG